MYAPQPTWRSCAASLKLRVMAIRARPVVRAWTGEEGSVIYRDSRHKGRRKSEVFYRDSGHRMGSLVAGWTPRLLYRLKPTVYRYREPGHAAQPPFLPGFQTPRRRSRFAGGPATCFGESAHVPGFGTRNGQPVRPLLPGTRAQKLVKPPGSGDTKVPGTRTRFPRDSRHGKTRHYRDTGHETGRQVREILCVSKDQLLVLKLEKLNNNSPRCCLFRRKGA